jgi:hypothetical protein
MIANESSLNRENRFVRARYKQRRRATCTETIGLRSTPVVLLLDEYTPALPFRGYPPTYILRYMINIPWPWQSGTDHHTGGCATPPPTSNKCTSELSPDLQYPPGENTDLQQMAVSTANSLQYLFSQHNELRTMVGTTDPVHH